jgi:putative phage-type endonuclease
VPELVDVVPGSQEWLAARRAGITATDLPAILGISPYDSPYSLYWRKAGVLPDMPDNPRFALGRYLEPYIFELWAKAHDPGSSTAGAELVRSSDRPWQLATVDRLVWMPGVPAIEGEPVECKSWADVARDMWDDGPPAAVRAQVLWQMDVMGVSTGHVAVLFLPSGELASYVIEHSAECAWRVVNPVSSLTPGHCAACRDIDLMRKAGYEFMTRVESGPPPDVDGSAATLAALHARYAPVPKTQAEIDADLWQRYDDWSNSLSAAKGMRDLFQAQIRELAGNAHELTVAGEVVARFAKNGALRRVKAREADNASE